MEYISARLMKVRLNLKGKSNGIFFVVAYAPTDSHKSVRDKIPFLGHTKQHCVVKCLKENTFL